ncbi:hypothetical protein KOW79_001727 [Hemibagrus wyckioides]|uniref:Uncharacterized protein n=1 Tax=Hemibagrus wyckioides TaxID=337641 RepID=A0A9D3P6V9_9TELE|nr:hypothetical protein KOW79_001727 [Hemibagrus wyckioides]
MHHLNILLPDRDDKNHHHHQQQQLWKWIPGKQTPSTCFTWILAVEEDVCFFAVMDGLNLQEGEKLSYVL